MEEQTKHESHKDHKPSKSPMPPVSGPLAQLEAWMYDMLVYKAPYQLPKGFTDWVVINTALGLALVIGVLMLPLILGVFTVSTYVGVYASYFTVSVSPLYYVAIAMLVIQVIVMFISIPMLLKRQRAGWLLLFYADLVSLAYSVFNSFSYGFNFGGLLMGLIGAAVGFYVVFQIRSYYTK